MNNLDPILDQSISDIRDRLIDVEAEYLKIAGSRLLKIYTMSKEEQLVYFYSADYMLDIRSDINKVKRMLLATHKQNVRKIKGLEQSIIDTVYKNADDLVKKRDVLKAAK